MTSFQLLFSPQGIVVNEETVNLCHYVHYQVYESQTLIFLVICLLQSQVNNVLTISMNLLDSITSLAASV
jgi:hypothetical protein